MKTLSHVKLIALAACLTLGAMPAHAEQASLPVQLSQAQLIKEKTAVQSAFAAWRSALSSGKAQTIVALYADDAVLLATLAQQPILTQADRTAYFSTLMAKPKLAVKLDEEHVRLLDDNSAVVSGLYTFSYNDQGQSVKIPARYTFVFEDMGGQWKIVEHHSSKIPPLN